MVLHIDLETGQSTETEVIAEERSTFPPEPPKDPIYGMLFSLEACSELGRGQGPPLHRIE